ncbi:hypothetical protein H2201_002082 [Coniosporium apollinis]|uniref:DSBA-like thioredoxin domain-containing protein n=2 Tax=Coniosporium TaxID=2810619 RepID=A0ABQ9P3J1_9PEZI|nr:hypothetical protein H2199_000913 [Cladosporium sp. JES 115]KAJ9667896.1 hypothetical protein H2201_002082 [Coniosporium apollinis]
MADRLEGEPLDHLRRLIRLFAWQPASRNDAQKLADRFQSRWGLRLDLQVIANEAKALGGRITTGVQFFTAGQDRGIVESWGTYPPHVTKEDRAIAIAQQWHANYEGCQIFWQDILEEARVLGLPMM